MAVDIVHRANTRNRYDEPVLFRGDMLPLVRGTIRVDVGTIAVGTREWVVGAILRRPLLTAGGVLVALTSVAIVARL